MDALHWHVTLGHCNDRVLQHASKVYGFDFTPVPGATTNQPCHQCNLGKATKLPATSREDSQSRATKPLQRIHSDIHGPMVDGTGLQLGSQKQRYFVTLVDEYTGFSWAVPIPGKSDVLPVLQEFLAHVQTQYPDFRVDPSIRQWLRVLEPSCSEGSCRLWHST